MGDLRIVILEDVEADAALIEAELRREDIPFICRVVADRVAFTVAIETFRPQAILSDYKLPGFSGVEALRHVRDRGLDTAFILVTGSQSEEVVAECFKLGADDYVLKSSLTRLPGALLNALHRRQADRERSQTLHRLRDRERQLEQAQALAHLGIWEADHVSGRVTWSQELCRIWGIEPGRGPGVEPLLEGIHPDDTDLAAWAVSESRAGRPFELVFRVIRPDGAVRTVHCRASVTTDAEGTLIHTLGTVLDITDLRAARESQRKSEQRFAKVFLNNPSAIGLVTPEGRVVDVNEKYAALFGYVREEMIGRSVYELGIWADATQRLVLVERLLTHGSLREVQTRFQRKNGQVFDGLASMEKIELEDEVVLMTMFTDVTELKRSREELRLLARGLQAIREEERTRMAREIHDELGQALTAIKMDLAWMRPRLRKDQRDVAGRCTAVMKLADGTIDTVRRLSAELRPSVLDDLGLSAAVEWVVEDYQRRSGIRATLDMTANTATLSRDLATAVFRILQEALTNVARHASAGNVWVRLIEDHKDLMLEVRDDGRGLAADQLRASSSLGVLGMRERAAGMGGELTLSGAPGQGAVVRARFPLGGVR